MHNKIQINKVLEELLQLLDIPPSYYEKAVARYKSMADHFHRPESIIRHLDPYVHLQGSFRLGTVIRVFYEGGGYDLDLVCRVLAEKTMLSQKELKELIGEEVIAYSRANGFSTAPENKRRCWTQQYQDEVDFHMDILPSIPAGDRYRRSLAEAGVGERLREEAINITDKTEPNYSAISPDWPRSNPRGFARWFEERMDVGGVASTKRALLFEARREVYESVEDVPTYALKTPLQRVVQLLKRHRDHLFRDDPEGKPISIILTTLAARAYRGEQDVAEAVGAVLDRMGDFVNKQKPRIPNPVDPRGEDFADRWTKELEDNFWWWLRQAKDHFAALGNANSADILSECVEDSFGLSLRGEVAKACLSRPIVAPAVVGLTSVSSSAPRSWGER